jgi:hypothetical protein
MPASQSDRDPFGSLDLRSLPAQCDQADDARRYLRRRREVLLCILVAVLGVVVARSIPLFEHEQELCACADHRASRATARDVQRRLDGRMTRVVARDLIPLAASPDRAPVQGPALIAVTGDEGAWPAPMLFEASR